MKRHMLIIMCAAVVSFLIGTLVSMGLTANGIMPNPFEPLLHRTPELQTRIVRLIQSDEVSATNETLAHWDSYVATFVWVPKNPEDNSILAIHYYCEYRNEGNPPPIVWEGNGGFWWRMQFRLFINKYGGTEEATVRDTFFSQQEWESRAFLQWQKASFLGQSRSGVWINPNQNNYTITLRALHGDRAGASVPSYVRNINIFMEVIDG